MILRLHLQDFIIVGRATLDFSPGLNVLSGETGAGKSILVDALSFLAGGRATTECIRRGAARTSVEAALAWHGDEEPERLLKEGLERLGISLQGSEGEEALVLRREMGSDGRSRCLANGQQLLVSQLRELTARVLWIVGQGEQRALLTPAEQLWLLDRFASTLDLRESYRAERGRLLQQRELLGDLRRRRELFLQEEEWLRFQAREIREAALAMGERERLVQGRQEAKERAKEAAMVDEIERRLYRDEGSLTDHLESMLHLLGGVSGASWEEIRRKLLELREVVRELRRQLPEGAAGPVEEEGPDPEALQERLRLLERLCKKYGGSEEAVLSHLEVVEARLAEGELQAEQIRSAETALLSLREETGRLGAALSVRRREGAKELAKRATHELAGLGMHGASVGFCFSEEEDSEGVILADRLLRPLESGLERVRLLFRPHPSEAEGDLSHVASGGELSRILLALHAAMGESGPPGCWILDEVDSGIGGETAHHVGERLSAMAGRAQVLLVTHLPVIAARADRHLGVRKREEDGRPTAVVELLEGEARVREIARMLSGETEAPIALEHARELLMAARTPRRKTSQGTKTR